MKNIMSKSAVIAAMLALAVAVPAFAQQTTGTSLDALLQSLQAKVATLQAQLQALNNQRIQVQQAQTDVQSTLQLIAGLQVGSTGDQVKILQSILAADPTIFPAGKITGYFGKLTQDAVKRFQRKYKLTKSQSATSTQKIDDDTTEKLNELLKEHPVLSVGSNGSTTLCAFVPPGHFIAPGWLRKHGTPILPTCENLPPGIFGHLGGGSSTSTPTSTVDMTPPVISAIVAGTTTSTATITWNTDEAATSNVWVSTSLPVATNVAPAANSATLTTTHSLMVTGLNPNTMYFFVVGSADASGNNALASAATLVTLSIADTTPPQISGLTATAVTSSSAHIVWSTNELSTSNAWVATSSPVATTTAPAASNASLVINHDLLLSGLNASTTYRYVISSADASGNTTTASEAIFTTTQ